MSAPTVSKAITVTERIHREISRQEKFRTNVAQLAGIGPDRWNASSRNDDWRTRDLLAIARVLGVTVEWLAGVDEDNDEEEAA